MTSSTAATVMVALKIGFQQQQSVTIMLQQEKPNGMAFSRSF
jgi:hypothetical protein